MFEQQLSQDFPFPICISLTNANIRIQLGEELKLVLKLVKIILEYLFFCCSIDFV